MPLFDTAIRCLTRSLAIHTGKYLGGKLDNAIEDSRERKEEEERMLTQRKRSSFFAGVKNARENRYEEALKYFQRAYDFGLHSNSCKYNLGVCHTHLKNFEQAISFLQEAISIEGSKETLATAYIGDSIKNDEIVDFLMDMRKLENYAIGTEIQKENMINTINIKLANYFVVHDNKMNNENIVTLKEALILNENNKKYITTICKYYMNQQEYNSVIYYAEKFPGKLTDEEILKMYAISLKELDDKSDKALKASITYLKVIPEDDKMRLYVGEMFRLREMYVNEIELYQEGLKIDVTHSLLKMNMAKAFIKIEQIDKAVIEIQSILNAQSEFSTMNQSELHKLLGICFMKKGVYRISLKQFLLCDDKITVLNYLYVLGQIFESKGDNEDARLCWEEIYSVDATYKDISTKLA